MTLEELKEEMKKRGCSKAQIESHALVIACDIMSKSDGLLVDTFKLEERAEKAKQRCTKYEERNQRLASNRETLRREIISLEDNLTSKRKELETQLLEEREKFEEKLSECETAEARDKLRMARFYLKNVDTENQYTQKGITWSLGAILSGTRIPDFGSNAHRESDEE